MRDRTLQQFLADLLSSRLVDERALARIRSGDAVPAEPPGLATVLKDRGLLTDWQARELLRGRTSFYLGKYRLLEQLNSGGMGDVFKAVHVVMDRAVALKLIRKDLVDNPEAVRRFQTEIRACTALEHPNIVRAYDADCVDDTHFLVMEYVEGLDLHGWVAERGALPVELACNFCRQAALGLEHAHQRGMVHRDIKPANLLVTCTHSKTGVVKILDFGLAKFVSETSPAGITAAGRLLGTLDFIAPEQITSPGAFDPRVDVYCLGVSLYFLLVEGVPFDRGTPTQRLYQRLAASAPPVQKARPDVPPEVGFIVATALARRPTQRYQSAAEMATALRRWLASRNRRAAVERAHATRRAAEARLAEAPLRSGEPVGSRRPRLTAEPDWHAPPEEDVPLWTSHWLGVVAIALAVVSLLLAWQLSPTRDSRPEGSASPSASAFSSHPYHVCWQDLRRSGPQATIDLPLETNCEGVRLELSDAGAPGAPTHPVQLSCSRVRRLTAVAHLPLSVLHQGRRYTLSIQGVQRDGTPFEAHKSLEVCGEPGPIRKIHPPGGKPLTEERGEIVLRVDGDRDLRVFQEEAREPLDEEGVFRLPYDLAAQMNCVFPVEGSRSDVLVPLTLVSPCGAESSRVVHFAYEPPRKPAPILRIPLIEYGDPADLAGAATEQLLAAERSCREVARVLAGSESAAEPLDLLAAERDLVARRTRAELDRRKSSLEQLSTRFRDVQSVEFTRSVFPKTAAVRLRRAEDNREQLLHSMSALAGALLRPASPREALVDRVVFIPSSTLPPLTREGLRLLAEAPDPEDLVWQEGRRVGSTTGSWS